MEALMVSELKGYMRYTSEQSPYNLLDRRIENELVPMCQNHGIGIIAWAPLAMGVLAGRYKNAKKFPQDSRAAYRGGFYAERVTESGISVAAEFDKIANKLGISPAQLAILWCKDQPGITAPLIGPRTMEHLEEFLPVLEMDLDDETRKACDQLVPPGSAVANFFNTSGWMKMQIL
jgi:aryl-alcohol dehydrogenase-like predicted oxidoreductase